MTKFRLGDRVRAATRFPEDPYSGLVGTVVNVRPETYVVEFEVGRFETYWWYELRPADISPQESDSVNHPAHYSQGMPEGVEVIDVIRAQKADYLHGNVIKYVLRWKFKNGVEDLKKAQTHLSWLIEQEEAGNE